MLVGNIREDELIRSLFDSLVDDLSDDTACLKPPSNMELLCSTDSLIEGIHFLRHVDPALIGEKLVRANASDLVASGGRPLWLTLAMSLPKELPLVWLERWVEGLGQALTDTGMILIGGDTTASPGPLFFSGTAIGQVGPGQRLTRSGAKAGDLIAVTGHFGEAQLGLAAMLRGPDASLDEAQQRYVRRHFSPPFRGSFVTALGQSVGVTAMMDLSDGLATDLPRLCQASRVDFQLELSRIPMKEETITRGQDCLSAFHGGEEFELLLTFPESEEERAQKCAKLTNTPLTTIGRLVTPGNGWLRLHGKPVQAGKTWQHFS